MPYVYFLLQFHVRIDVVNLVREILDSLYCGYSICVISIVHMRHFRQWRSMGEQEDGRLRCNFWERGYKIPSEKIKKAQAIGNPNIQCRLILNRLLIG